MTAAAAALQAAAIAALERVEGMGATYPGPPLQAALPHAVVECRAETDWSHKSGAGRELQLAVTIRAGGERPEAAQALADASEAALAAGLDPQEWRLVTLRLVRRMTVGAGRAGEPAWAVLSEYRARMLAE